MTHPTSRSPTECGGRNPSRPFRPPQLPTPLLKDKGRPSYVYGAQAVVPATHHLRALARLCEPSWLKTNKDRWKAIYWPGINADLAKTVGACEPCLVRAIAYVPNFTF